MLAENGRQNRSCRWYLKRLTGRKTTFSFPLRFQFFQQCRSSIGWFDGVDVWVVLQIYFITVKNTFGSTILLLFSLQCYWQVLQTSTDSDQQFSDPFKAWNYRQVKTCYKPMVQTQRKLQHFLVCTGAGETGVLTTLALSVNLTTLAALRASFFTFGIG